MRCALFVAVLLVSSSMLSAADGNRLTYLDEPWNIYYPSRTFPKLTTPMWVGEEGVECVITLGIDDMRGPEKWETFLRPILKRLQKIDGRAPISIMTCQIDPKHEHLQTWLKEGLSLETHTFDHPCPLFKIGGIDKVKETYDKCVDLLASVPNNRPVAFRVPCCDSLNTPTPRFYLNVFNKTTPQGNFLELDSSVFNVFTPDDPELPKDVFKGAEGANRFRKYLPSDRAFVNTIENYPYPYVLGGLCWEFPCVTPSDWSAQHFHKPNNPITVHDWKAALDCCVAKQGTFNLVFHPHGWIKGEQIIDLIDYATEKYGKRVKFLTFKECRDRLTKNLLGGVPLRDPDGLDNGVRLIDLDNDGCFDVVIGNQKAGTTRRWSPKSKTWTEGRGPELLKVGRFAIIDGQVCLLSDSARPGCTRFNGVNWVEDRSLDTALDAEGSSGLGTKKPSNDQRKSSVLKFGHWEGYRLRDIDGDGTCELICSDDRKEAMFRWDVKMRLWKRLPFVIPKDALFPGILAASGGNLRFIDLDEDGHADIVFSNEKGYGIYLWESMEKGWSRKVIAGKAGDKDALPLISRKGQDNGFFVHSRALYWANEDTWTLKDHVDRRSFDELLKNVEPGPKKPDASLKLMQARPGFKVELVAAEPLVEDPIAFAWGPDGKFWVVEMGDYPKGIDGQGKFGGKVKFLEDTDGDGKYDKATVFLEGLGFPTGVLPWRNGVLITCAPDILYAEDANGDGKADKKVALFTGFGQGNQQHRVNTLAWGLDNWIYVANGDSGGRIKSVKTGKEVNISGRDLRIRPDTGELETVTGQTQFGRCRDDWGNWFGGNNSNPVWHFALEDQYLKRNPHVIPPDPRVSISVTPGAAPVYPISRTLPRYNDLHTANRFTSACSPTIYRDDLFGPEFVGNVFVSEPVHNLVHREIVTPNGTTFTSKRADDEQKSEFLASRDNWFRPTMIQTGPDGALWVADMYRHVIEHPTWIPLETQKKLDLRAGHDKGRIYRVYPEDKKPRAIPRMDKLDTAGLVAALDSPNGWQRDLAHMMLLWRLNDVTEKDRKLADALAELMLQFKRKSNNPLVRIHELSILEGLGKNSLETLVDALKDPHPGVRRQAVRLCNSRSATNEAIENALVALAADPDPMVRMQLAYSLEGEKTKASGVALAKLILNEPNNRFLTAAVLSSVNDRNIESLLTTVLKEAKGAPPTALLDGLLRTAIGMKYPAAIADMLDQIAKPTDGKFAAWQFSALAALMETQEARGSRLSDLMRQWKEQLGNAPAAVAKLLDAARQLAGDEKADLSERKLAISLLGRDPERRPADRNALGELLSPQTADEIQRAAAAALGRMDDPNSVLLLMKGWKSYAPSLRTVVLDAILIRDEGARTIMDALEKKAILPSEIDAVRAQRLLQHRVASLRKRAEKLFVATLDPDRQKVLDSFKNVLTMNGDAARGKPLFTKYCAICHQFAGEGNAVGPDLASVADKSNQALLIAVLDPNRAVEARYMQYLAERKNGQRLVGVLTAETSTSVTLVTDDGNARVLLRQDLESLVSTGRSAMPDGLERQIKAEEFADVFAHLRAASPAPKRKTFEGNTPQVVRPEPTGGLKLTAALAEIYGPTVVLERQYCNLGYWSSVDDHAAWEIEIPQAGKYEVTLDWACDKANAGNRYQLLHPGGALKGEVASTGTWDAYKTAKIGEIELKEGRQRLTFRSDGPIRGAMIDLRGIRLVLVK